MLRLYFASLSHHASFQIQIYSSSCSTSLILWFASWSIPLSMGIDGGRRSEVSCEKLERWRAEGGGIDRSIFEFVVFSFESLFFFFSSLF
ncbi:uncharacterized protein DS421_8g243120 [Arachis hypogaea]|nr:uncharacterized protein DS421_8g243120 [Arachis hypogaea]